MAANQAGIDSGLQAIEAMRTGQITARGQDIQADTTITDRELAEAGAYDRRLLGLDETQMRGEFGLLEQGMRNAGAIAAKQTMDPLKRAQLRIGLGIESGIDDLPADKRAAAYANVGDYYAGNSSLASGFTPPTSTYYDAMGNEYTGTPEEAMAYRALTDPVYRQSLQAQGIIVDPESGAITRVTGRGQNPAGPQGSQTSTSDETPVSREPPRTQLSALSTPVGGLPPGGGRMAVARENAPAREADAAAAQIDSVIYDGFTPRTSAGNRTRGVDSAAEQKRAFVERWGPYFSQYPIEQQKQLRQKLGPAADDFLSPDALKGS